jgi:YspA, cpYpsA-related SLOG family
MTAVEKPKIHRAQDELVAFAVAVREDWTAADVLGALCAAAPAGVTWEQAVVALARLMVDPAAGPRELIPDWRDATAPRRPADPASMDAALDEYVRNAIRQVLNEVPAGRRAVFVHGACRTGADAIADCYLRYIGADVERHPAKWRRFGKKAGPIRNAEMADSGADVLLAFLDYCRKPECEKPQPHWSHGAAGTVELAEAAGIPVRPYEQTGGDRDAA